MQRDVTEFVGVVVNRGANGSGIVEISSPASIQNKAASFSLDVVHTPEVSKVVQVGRTVRGFAVPLGDNFKILRIEPK
jgi:hypothetical protein